MKFFLISDNDDTLTGMRLAGVPGTVVHEKFQFQDALLKASQDKEIAVIIITEKLGFDFPELVRDMRISKGLPLLVEIPDRHGSVRPSDFITRYVQEAIGIKMDVY